MERNNASRPNARPSTRQTGNKSKNRASSGDGKQFGKDKPFTGNKSRQSGFPKTGFRSGSTTGRTGVASAPRSARPAKAIPVPVVPKVSDGRERINVALRNTGKATRREADELIEGGKVYVNGVKATLGMRVLPTDKIELRGKGKDYRYFLYNKPAGIVTTQPQPGEKDIVSTSKFPTKVFPIGRLDKESTGLLILTNDGRITDDMLSPEKDHEKEYIVSVDKMVTRIFKEKMEKGVLIGGDLKMDQYKTRPCKVNLIGEKSFSIILTEGKNRQIRRMTEALGFKVMKLERIRIGKFMIGKLKPGEWREVKI
ncbi:MAG: rRNA pseudouridine synthase [Candidatus Pacebacteria bacterium]|jgi:23S rRNA pseudouridine2604 synthase|nr:rRNA pseudouridine synthase [Candidatus Paceibacterota bacterium]MBP9852110.1 rRNA pseudouridine synthase [Candidatus Paceibacterota bacterium]